jgi:pyrimidine deaminase RibD-like protein
MTIRIATKEAAKSIHPKYFHGSTIIKSGNLISSGHNSGKGGVHAEISALRNKKGISFKGCTIISIRLLKDGGFGMAKPCKNCEAAIKEAGLKRLIYSDWTGQLITVKL